MYNWNPIFNTVIDIKYNYKNKFNQFDTYHFETWLQKLNEQKYNDIFDCLQINQDSDFILIRYGVAEMQRSMWTEEDSIYRECRSVVIDIVNDKLVLTPWRKFFNLGEVEENQLDAITEKWKTAKVVEIADKLDGSMQSARWYNNKVFMAGSMALNPKSSWRLEEGYSMLTDNHIRMIKENPELTFTFEYISLHDAHVVVYEKSQEGLYLIGIRNSVTGRQYHYYEIQEMSQKYGVKVVQLETKTLDDLLEGMKQYQSYEKEGWVLNLDGHLIKLKCDDYVNIHRVLDKVSSVNVVIQAIADGRYDDLISKIPEKYQDRVHKIADIIFDYVADAHQQINEIYHAAPKGERKDFMIYVDTNAPKELRGYIKNKYFCNEFSVLKTGKNAGYKRLKDMGIEEEYSALFSNQEVD